MLHHSVVAIKLRVCRFNAFLFEFRAEGLVTSIWQLSWQVISAVLDLVLHSILVIEVAEASVDVLDTLKVNFSVQLFLCELFTIQLCKFGALVHDLLELQLLRVLTCGLCLLPGSTLDFWAFYRIHPYEGKFKSACTGNLVVVTRTLGFNDILIAS